nr:hypothetical protein [uncultured Rhodopila sp.]
MPLLGVNDTDDIPAGLDNARISLVPVGGLTQQATVHFGPAHVVVSSTHGQRQVLRRDQGGGTTTFRNSGPGTVDIEYY